jgi:hypothetical protein
MAKTSKIGMGGDVLSSHPLPNSVFFTSIKVAGTEIAHPAGVPLLDDLKASDLDGTKALAIQWACTAGTTAGMGCPTGSSKNLTNFVGLAGVSSSNPRTLFAQTPKYGTLTCFENESKTANPLGTTNPGDFTLNVSAAHIAALVANQKGGGSVELVFFHFEADPVLSGQLQLHAAGHGSFVFLDL